MKLNFIIVSFFFINIILINVVNSFVITFGTIVTIGGIIRMVAHDVLEAWDIVDSASPETDNDIPFLKHRQKKIFKRLAEVTQQIDDVEKHVTNQAQWTIQSFEKFAKINTKLELGLHTLTDLINRISIHESRMQEYTDQIEKLEETTIQDYINVILSQNANGVQSLLDRIHFLAFGTVDLRSVGNRGVIELMAQQLEETETYATSIRQSTQQVLIQLYNAISITELKGYTMMQFSWMLLKAYGKGNYTTEAKLMRKRFEERTEKAQLFLRDILKRADRSVMRGDPNHHVEGESYVQLTRLLQGYIENEVDLNSDGVCRESCDYYQFTENKGCFKDQFCAQQPKCHGKILKCQYVDSDMTVCLSPKNNSTRRYEYIEYENGRILGKKGSCERSTKVDSWWRWLFWHCSYCFCYCDEQGPKSDRYFNLREVLANTTANKVVTGLRFRKVNRVIHLQIQEGEIMPRGNINPTTVQWKTVDGYDIRQSGVRNAVDYHTMAWDRRAIDLDDIIADPGHIVTGVKFRVVGTHVNLEIRVTEIDFVTGRLIDPDHTSIWISNDNTESSKNKRIQIQIFKPDIPIKTGSNSVIKSNSNQFIEFTHTDMDADGAQTTVPFIDAQDVYSEPPVPLSGAGLYYKGKTRSGGYIGPKIITYDYSPHIQTPDREINPDNLDNTIAYETV